LAAYFMSPSPAGALHPQRPVDQQRQFKLLGRCFYVATLSRRRFNRLVFSGAYHAPSRPSAQVK